MRRVRASELKPGDLIACSDDVPPACVEFIEVHTHASVRDYNHFGAVIVRYSGGGASTGQGWLAFKPDDEVTVR